MPERVEDRVTINKGSLWRLLGLAVVVLFVILSWFWWDKVHLSQQNVFWGMIDNNLATNSISRHVVQTNQGQTLDQDIQLEFGAFTGAHSFITLSQVSSDNKTTVKSETIGTSKTDYSRYLSIKTTQRNSKNQPLDTSHIINLWAKTDQTAGAPPKGQYLSQAIFTIVPYGNFDAVARKDLVRFIKDHNVYGLANTKNAKVNGRPVYVYSVNVNAAAYIASLAKYTKALGLGDLGLDASQYQDSPALQVQLTVDKLSRHLLKIYYPSNQQEETFYSQGLEAQLHEPTATIPLSTLQDRIQAITQ